MPRPRLRTRVDLLAEAADATAATGVELRRIDLQRTRGALRDDIRTARRLAEELQAVLIEALRADIPGNSRQASGEQIRPKQ